MNIKSISIPLAKQIEKEIKENPFGVVIAEALIYKAIEAAQQSAQQTALGFGVFGFICGVIIEVLMVCTGGGCR